MTQRILGEFRKGKAFLVGYTLCLRIRRTTTMMTMVREVPRVTEMLRL